MCVPLLHILFFDYFPHQELNNCSSYFCTFPQGLPDTIFFPLDYSTDIKKKSTFAIFRYAAGQGDQQNMLTQ